MGWCRGGVPVLLPTTSCLQYVVAITNCNTLQPTTACSLCWAHTCAHTHGVRKYSYAVAAGRWCVGSVFGHVLLVACATLCGACSGVFLGRVYRNSFFCVGVSTGVLSGDSGVSTGVLWCSLVFSGVSIRCRSEVDGRTLTVEKGRRTERDRDGGGAPPKGPRETFQNRVCYVLQICAGTPNTTQKNGWGKLSGSRTGLDAARASVYIYVAASASTLEQGRNAAALTLEQENSFFNTPGIDMCT